MSDNLFDLLIKNWSSADYEMPITAFHSYESSEDNGWPELSPREIINSELGAGMTGRQFSQFLMTRGMTLAEIAKLQKMRFMYDGTLVIGRDIVFTMGVQIPIVQKMIERVNEDNSKKKVVTALYGDITYWRTDTGKRTYHGKPDNGMVKRKNFSREHPDYKRNRRVR